MAKRLGLELSGRTRSVSGRPERLPVQMSPGSVEPNHRRQRAQLRDHIAPEPGPSEATPCVVIKSP